MTMYSCSLLQLKYIQFSVQMMYSVRDRARVVHSANVNKNVW